MESNLFTKYVLEANVVSEVFIWSGNDILVGYDIVFVNDRAYLIDHDLMASKLLETSSRNILGELKNVLNIGLGLPGFLKKYGIRVDDISRDTLPVKDRRILMETYRYVKDHIRMKNKPYIPGSEIKGVLRTALLNFFVGTGKIPRKTIDEIMQGLDKEIIKEKNAGWGIEKIFKMILSYENYSRRVQQHYVDILHYLHVSDPLEMRSRYAVDTIAVVKRTDPGKTAAIQPIIGLEEGSRFIYEVNLYRPIREDASGYGTEIGKLLEKYNEVYTVFFDALRYFSLKLIDYEIRQLSKLPSARQFVERLKSWRGEVEAGKAYYFKIGFGAGMYSKTIYLSLNREEQAQLIDIMSRKIRRRTRGKIHVWDTLTLKLVGSRYPSEIVPFGWVRFSFKNLS